VEMQLWTGSSHTGLPKDSIWEKQGLPNRYYHNIHICEELSARQAASLYDPGSLVSGVVEVKAEAVLPPKRYKCSSYTLRLGLDEEVVL
jgi:hypothetical protein